MSLRRLGHVVERDGFAQTFESAANLLDLSGELRVVEQKLRFGIADDVSRLLRLQKRVDRPSERAELEAREVSDDVLRAVRHQKAHNLALGRAARGEHIR